MSTDPGHSGLQEGVTNASDSLSAGSQYAINMEDDDDMSLDLDTTSLSDTGDSEANKSDQANAAMDNVVTYDSQHASNSTNVPQDGQSPMHRRYKVHKPETVDKLWAQLIQLWPPMPGAPWPYADNIYSYFPVNFPPSSPDPYDWPFGILPALVDLATVAPGWWRILVLPELANIALDRIATERDAPSDPSAAPAKAPRHHTVRYITKEDIHLCTGLAADMTGQRPAPWPQAKQDKVQKLIENRKRRPLLVLQREADEKQALVKHHHELFDAYNEKEAELNMVRANSARTIAMLKIANDRLEKENATLKS
ncbi:hypothetical protein UCRNP2_1768 [Neofusicoccum parvum UCRNP2]|uniref:Uncharacterized protein n=1 Tax=Botryosphaeria parva (strain UCR-NP2) TaxID=1287680 RepID=R1GID9_BOTPV|nr:hypothetical protein UCRNP2_1768 [Neofusicoccum parvum UCRNP2]